MPSVLIIEDEYALAAALSTVVRRLGAEPVVAASGQSGLDKARRQVFDVVLLDIGLPDMSGLKVLAGLRQQANPPEVLIITAHGSLENALEARRLGAREYFLKPLNLGEMQTCLRSLLGNGEERKAQAGAVLAEGAGEHTIMIGAAPGMQRAFAAIAQACSNTAPVLLSGPRGSGTTLAARVIHRNSRRSAGPLVVFRADEWPAAGQEAALQLACDKAAGGSLLVEEVASLSLPLQGLLAPETLACLKAHAWPGNVRELAAAMRHAAAVCAGSTVLPRHLPESVASAGHADGTGHLDEALKRALAAWMDQKLTGPEAAWPDYDALLAHVEKHMLESLLQRFEDKPTRLAAALNMNRATLRRKLRELLGRE
jgi:DNA-binding NtrC family response regulator